ncbi:U4/U6-U5 snRNP complex subunit prp31 [Microbotryomycetes sp. JL201]|nr:U4/U6-U5 snRNP complex subunit prp31 [Microbotryomycetes sp. JL201]
MTSLADELMNDLDSDAGSASDSEVAHDEAGPALQGGHAGLDGDGDNGGESNEVHVPEGGVKPAAELDPQSVNNMALGDVTEVAKVAKLAHSPTLRDVLKRIAYYREHPDPNLTESDNAEYQLIVQANNISVEIDNEMLIVHKASSASVQGWLRKELTSHNKQFIRDHYLTRFPELDSLVSGPLQYCRVILALGNGNDLRGDLSGILTSGTVMAVTVTAATTKGRPLEPDEWKTVVDACNMMFQLDDAKRTILEYVESRISLLAPNLSAILGTQTATKVLGIAGGLQGLTRIPHANVYLLGASKRASTGFSTASHSVDRLHTGFIYHCPLVQSTRKEDRMKAQRKVGAKVALAARVDAAGSCSDGSFGEEMVEKLEREFERLARPAPKKVTKALPRPDEKKKAHRGGKRARKAKEAYAMTELRKQQNRMAFGEAEEEVGALDETRGLGMIGSSSGRVRAETGEAKSKAKLSKMAKGRLASIKSTTAATSGLATSLAFTPVQGLELVDPSKLRNKVADANARWFQDGAFTHIPKEKGIGKPVQSESQQQ